jgi:hypothetical protein
MRKHKNIGTFFCALIMLMVSAQSIGQVKKDSINISPFVNYLKSGVFYGEVRNFTMSTINESELTDYFANAVGLSFRYSTASFYGFSARVGGLSVFRLYSNDLLKIDPIAQRSASYELQLFDLEKKGNYENLVKLQELYLAYRIQGLELRVGRMPIESPIVQIHDGRMNPKLFSGLQATYKRKETLLTAGWLNKASTRSAMLWHSIDNTIGIYNNGYQTNSDKALYYQYISSKGLGILGLETRQLKNFTFKIWEYFLENISTTLFTNIEYQRDSSFYGGLIYVYQSPLNNGGAKELAHTFHDPTEKTHAASMRIGYHFKQFDMHGNVTHILNTGRYLFPRELGVDPFYTFISRSQIEGFGNASSIGLSLLRKKRKLAMSIDWNRVIAANNPAFNKYAIPSYDQFNVDCTYTFLKNLSGLHLRFLYVYRRAINNNLPLSATFNRANFHQFNLIANLTF